MMNLRKLKGKMIEKGYTAGQLAKKIGIGNTSMSYKMNQHKPFNLFEIKKIIELLDLNSEEIMNIFFS